MKNQHDVSFSGPMMTMEHCCFVFDRDAPDVAACRICRNAGPKDSVWEWPDVVLEDILDAEIIGEA